MFQTKVVDLNEIYDIVMYQSSYGELCLHKFYERIKIWTYVAKLCNGIIFMSMVYSFYYVSQC
jgi:hypothetical protein